MVKWFRQDSLYRSVVNCCLVISLFMTIIPQFEPHLLIPFTFFAVIAGFVATYFYFKFSDRALTIKRDQEYSINMNNNLVSDTDNNDETSALSEDYLEYQLEEMHKSAFSAALTSKSQWDGIYKPEREKLKKADGNTVGSFTYSAGDYIKEQEEVINEILSEKMGYKPIVFMVGSIKIAITDEETTVEIMANSSDKINLIVPKGVVDQHYSSSMDRPQSYTLH